MAAIRRNRVLHVLLLLLLSFLISLQCHASTDTGAPAPSPDTVSGGFEAIKGDLLRDVGGRPSDPRDAVGAARWLLGAVDWILETKGWRANFSRKDRPDTKTLELAAGRVVTAVRWILDDPELNPYRSLDVGMQAFLNLGRYVREIEERKAFGRDANPVVRCFKAMWPECESRAPDTLEGAVVNRFHCYWVFYERCHLRVWALFGIWHVPVINTRRPPSRYIIH